MGHLCHVPWSDIEEMPVDVWRRYRKFVDQELKRAKANQRRGGGGSRAPRVRAGGGGRRGRS